MKRTGTLIAFAVLLLPTGCNEPTTRASSPPPSPTAAASRTPSEVTPEDVVRGSRSQLLDAVVRPAGDSFEVTAWWGCVVRGCQGRRAITSSSDGFATAAYGKWTSREWLRLSPLPTQGHVPAFEGLAQETVWSMEDGAEGVHVVIAGGDGATLKPFQKVGRSSDHGETWEAFDVAPIDAEMAYYSGAVGLPDGRLLVLLDHFSDDGPSAPADRSHGLWISDGRDWSSYAPYEPIFTPPLNPTGSWGPIVDVDVTAGVISVRTWDSKLYASTDAAVTFTEIPARSAN